ncbi:hypothetical protein DMB95_00645 [Campylobacter sp. MIT 12-8780]|uniref:hypothetical protein n=1 Tax=unclassified Campylobacter TaxID=2593542 RepID=UPI00115C981E|nr:MULTISPECIES: hypothetical protein [unclassified Campylobacter]NDJ26470.1 hypothetical protein [Campylobacter sp. MIT 19-121]TQR43040.1 hypothetical protein DMB95_00645 [Campylobacter sp. MIT 12-8780]
MKKIVILGSSNFLRVGGIRSAFIQDELELYNFSLAGMDAIAKISDIFRHKELMLQADLIIAESNLIDNTNSHTPLDHAVRNIYWLMQELYKLQRKVLILILPFKDDDRVKITNKTYAKLAFDYGFNLIDMYSFYKEKNVLDFYMNKIDPFHEINAIMQELGRNIVENIDNFHFPKQDKYLHENPNFKLLSAKDMICQDKLLAEHKKDFFADELVYKLKAGVRLYFPSEFKNFMPICVRTFSQDKHTRYANAFTTYSSFILQNKTQRLIKAVGLIHENNSIDFKFVIDEQSFVEFNAKNEAWSERSRHTALRDNTYSVLDYVDLIDFLCADNSGKWEFELLKADEELIKDEKYDFSYLVPDVVFYKTLIEQWCERTDNLKARPLNEKITALQAEIQKTKAELEQNLDIKKQNLEIKNLQADLSLKLAKARKEAKELGLSLQDLPFEFIYIEEEQSAKQRLQNHLAFKLGQAFILNYKSFLGILRLPFVLSYIKEKHKAELSPAKIKLEELKDYNQALSIKQSLSYQLGTELMKAYKNWYKGGFIAFVFKAKALQKEFKRKKQANFITK